MSKIMMILHKARKLILIATVLFCFLYLFYEAKSYNQYQDAGNIRSPDTQFTNQLSHQTALVATSTSFTSTSTTTQKCRLTLRSEWIQYFPALRSMLHKLPEKNIEDFRKSTCAHCSILHIHPGTYFQGTTLNATIEAKDYNHEQKQYGGDYFRAILRKPGVERDGISCLIEDHTNGNYSVTCELVWVGRAQLFVSLMHSSEGVYYLIANTSFSTSGVSYETTFINSMGKKEKSNCALTFDGIFNISQLCNYSHTKTGEPWFCVKPSSGECNPYTWQVNSNDVHVIKDVENNAYYNPKTNWHVRISGSQDPLDVLASPFEKNETMRKPLPSCKSLKSIDHRPSLPTGWINGGKWESLRCRNFKFDLNTKKQCLRNHVIYFIGDSTIRLWFEQFQKEFQTQSISENNNDPSVWSRSREHLAKEPNITIYYKAHGPPLRNPGPPSSRPYVSDTLENIKKGGRETIVFFSIGFHFQVFTPDVLIRRLRVIKKSFSDLKRRLPLVRIFVKGFHAHTETKAVIPTDWLSYRFDVILRNEFKEIPEITFLNMWDVSVVLKNPLIHPGGYAQKTYSDIFLSYVC